MGVINWVSFGGIIVDAIIVFFIFTTTYWYYRKGLVDVIIKILTFVIGLVITFLLYKQQRLWNIHK